jgi:ParB family chromosome partitioning protein
MDLEFHQLDRRYEELRRACRKEDSRVLASLDRDGQQLPVVVVKGGEDGRFVLVDGFKRVRALVKLGRDTVRATCWDLPEDEALLLGRLMRSGEGDSALEQGWLLQTLRSRFELTLDELAKRFGRSASWVSGRLGLVTALPEAIQQEVRAGRIAAYAATKFLLPLARANRADTLTLSAAIAPLEPSTRQTEALCVAFARSKRNTKARAELLAHPERFLRAREAGREALSVGAGELLLRDLGALGGMARRAMARVSDGAVRELLPPEHAALRQGAVSARDATEQLFTHIIKEIDDARRAHQDDHSRAS